MTPARGVPAWVVLLGASLLVAVGLTSCVGGVLLAKRASARVVIAQRGAASGADSASLDSRSVLVAEVLLASLRSDGARTLARLPQAAPDEQRLDPLAVHEKVVVIDGTVRDLRFERGLFVGRLRMYSGEDAYFVTPIAAEGLANDQRCSFRGLSVAVSAPSNEPRGIVVGAFDGC